MSLFEFLMVFVSIIVGLGVTEILSGLAQRIRHRKDVSGYWVHYCSQIRPIWSLARLAVVSSVMLGPLAFGSELVSADNASSVVLLAGFFALTISRNALLHAILVPLFTALILWDVIRFHPAFSIG